MRILNKRDAFSVGEGKHLYNLLNGYNAVAVLGIDQETGEISLLQQIAVEGIHPRICALSFDGRFPITTCLGGQIAVYRVGEDDLLTKTEHGAHLRGSAYITFFDSNL